MALDTHPLATVSLPRGPVTSFQGVTGGGSRSLGLGAGAWLSGAWELGAWEPGGLGRGAGSWGAGGLVACGPGGRPRERGPRAGGPCALCHGHLLFATAGGLGGHLPFATAGGLGGGRGAMSSCRTDYRCKSMMELHMAAFSRQFQFVPFPR